MKFEIFDVTFFEIISNKNKHTKLYLELNESLELMDYNLSWSQFNAPINESIKTNIKSSSKFVFFFYFKFN